MNSLERILILLSALRNRKMPARLDRHSPDEVTVTFICAGRVIEAAFDADGMWFSKFEKTEKPFSDSAFMAFLADRWRDEPNAPTSRSPAWLSIRDPFSRFLAFSEMLDEKKITWRIDSHANNQIVMFFTVIDARVEVSLDQAGLSFTVYDGSEDVFPAKDLSSFLPDFELDV